MVALTLQQFQYNLKKTFLRHLVFPILFGPIDAPPKGGRIAGVGGDFKGGQGTFESVTERLTRTGLRLWVFNFGRFCHSLAQMVTKSYRCATNWAAKAQHKGEVHD